MKKIYTMAMVIFLPASISIHPIVGSVGTLSLNTDVKTESIVDDRALRVDAYFKARKMPLEGYGMKFIQVADDNGIDWRLLPAISVKESSGGKHMCKNNPFGWASCKVQFASLNEAIETVGRNLGGNNPRTKVYYKGNTWEKLYSYNGTVEPEYPDRVVQIMEKF